jgi:transcriptional regulator with XRE-family HTH domain
MAILLPDRIDVATFGVFLRDARERRGLTLQQLARETRIPFRHLDALEHGHLDALPNGMYRRAEIRAYADAVGLDRGLALAQLEHALESSVAQETTRTSAAPRPDRARAAWTALGAIGVVAAATMFAVSLWNDRSRPVGGDAPRVGAVRSAPPAPVAVPEPEPLSIVEAPLMLPPAPADPVISTPISTALTLTSDPSGARVVVDGIGRGTTPVTVQNLTSGVRRVRVIKDGFVSLERDVRIGTGREPATLHVTLNTVH